MLNNCAFGVCLVEANPSADPSLLQEPIQRGLRSVYDGMLREANR